MPKTYAPQVWAYARERFRLGYSAAETARQMEADTRLAGFELPTKRTVEHWFARFRQEEAIEQWSPADTPPEDAQIVLAHWKRAVEWTVQNGFATPVISKIQAKRLIWVHKAAPDIPLSLAWIVANSYFDAPNRAYWDLLLATQAWRGKEATDEFYRLAEHLFGSPIGDLTAESRDDYHRRYPLGVTPFYLFGQEGKQPPPKA